jgi:hypothetical protein
MHQREKRKYLRIRGREMREADNLNVIFEQDTISDLYHLTTL